MTRILVLFLTSIAVIGCATPASDQPTQDSQPEARAATAAPETAKKAPDQVTLKTKMGNITFGHESHGQRMKCSVCHGAEIKAMAPLGQKAGHKLCLDCHKDKKAGPTKCGDCHKK